MTFSKKDKAFFEVSAWSLALLNEAANEKITLYFEEKGILRQTPITRLADPIKGAVAKYQKIFQRQYPTSSI